MQTWVGRLQGWGNHVSRVKLVNTVKVNVPLLIGRLFECFIVASYITTSLLCIVGDIVTGWGENRAGCLLIS
jgi:hypothetical protein